MSRLSIDASRLFSSLEALGKIGAYADEGTGLFGVNRLALSDADAEGRRHVVQCMKDLGLSVTVDRIGNVFGRRSGVNDSLSPVMIGSHIDSVPTAGMFDGCLGVLGGLEIVRTLNAAKRQTKRPIVVAFFTDEEGCRFGTDMLGSAVATGRIALSDAYELRDANGMVLRTELERIGFLGTTQEHLDPPYAYLECHIEQGPLLRARGQDIGVVTGVQAISWQEVTILGKSAHAGTTPMDLRADAGLAASRINVHLREMIASGKYGSAMRATMGAIRPQPNLVNIVPGRVRATVDLRNPDDVAMQRAEEELRAFYARVSEEEKVHIHWRQTARTPHVPFHHDVQERVAASARDRGLAHESLVSGAGHDAQEMARVTRTGMVFVPGEYDGISHNPREFSTPEQCSHGVNVLLDVALSFADEASAP